MKKLLFILSACLLIYNCNHTKSSDAKLSQLIPETSSIVLNINDLEAFKSDLKNNAFIDKITETSLYKDINSPLEHLNSKTPILLCFEKLEDESSFTIITKYTDSLFPNQNIDSLNIYTKIIDSIFIGSSSSNIIDKLKINEQPLFESLESVSSPDASFSMFLDKATSKVFGSSIFGDSINGLSNLTLLDTEITLDQMNFNGIATSNDTLPKLIDLFKNTIPQENTIQNIVPASSAGFLSFTYDDFSVIQENILKYNSKKIDSTLTFNLFETINEVGLLNINDEDIIVLKSIDAYATKEALNTHQNVLSNFRNVDILEFNNSSTFVDTFNPLITSSTVSKYIIIDEFFVFANSENVLQDIITNYQNGTTYNTSEAYKETSKALSDESSLLVVSNANTLKQIIQKTFNENITGINLNQFKVSAFQLIQGDTFTHINGVIKKNKTRAQQYSIQEEFNVTLEADLLTQPQFVINHRTKQKDIAVQDINNNLYLISNKGKVLWKKKLNGNILGNIQQVDLYKNGRLQLAFATPKRVYILDRNGNNVTPFPLKFNNDITQPLSIFDYDNKKNYRFVVTQNNILLMYDRNGKSVSGFRYRNTANSITTQPKHFRRNNKDYIVFTAGNTMKILNRRGQSRVDVKENISFSNNSIFKYKNIFTTTTTSGELVQVNLKGSVSKQSLNLPSNHALETTNKTLVTLAENKLSIKQKTIELDFGNYTAPKIFYLNDKIYVSVTDLQSQKVYLFDSQSRPITNFPVYGNSLIDLANIDNDNQLEFVTQGESNSIIVYQKN